MIPTKLKILIVEDNPGDVVLLVDAFKQFGNGEFELAHASTFEFALKLVAQEQIDAILLDLSLPVFLGLEPLDRIHKLRVRIPIFVLSGYNDPELAKEAIGKGAQNYIVKNKLDGAALIKQVREAIDHRKKFSGKKEPEIRPS